MIDTNPTDNLAADPSVNPSANPVGRHLPKLWLMVTVAVVLLAALGVGYYFYQANKVADSSPASTPASEKATPAPAGTAPPETSVENSTVQTVGAELKAADVKGLKAAVAELKTSLATFKQ